MAFQFDQEQMKQKVIQTEDEEKKPEDKITLRSYTRALSSPSMLLLPLSHFLLHLGIFSTFSFSSDRAVQAGLTLSQSSLLLSIMGASNCLGRILFGLTSFPLLLLFW